DEAERDGFRTRAGEGRARTARRTRPGRARGRAAACRGTYRTRARAPRAGRHRRARRGGEARRSREARAIPREPRVGGRDEGARAGRRPAMPEHANPVDPPDLGLLPTLRRLLRLWRAEWRLGALGCAFALGYTLISITIPLLTQRAIDDAIVTHSRRLWPYI